MSGSQNQAIRQIDVRFMGATVRVPNTVVHRSFPSETIVLDLNAGVYHGLNHVAGRMLELLGERGRVRDVANRMAEEFDASPTEIQRDLCLLCQELLDRGLIELVEPLS
ncbi:MAG TPA: PqqD family protein [Solirubrobacterales bacterium]|jgi:hypothetical protein|nr:PqqD family protein [Solirubrobacterales bacterium]